MIILTTAPHNLVRMVELAYHLETPTLVTVRMVLKESTVTISLQDVRQIVVPMVEHVLLMETVSLAIVLKGLLEQYVMKMLMTVLTIYVKIMQHVVTQGSTLILVLVPMVILVNTVIWILMIVILTIVVMEQLALMQWQTFHVSVYKDLQVICVTLIILIVDVWQYLVKMEVLALAAVLMLFTVSV